MLRIETLCGSRCQKRLLGEINVLLIRQLTVYRREGGRTFDNKRTESLIVKALSRIAPYRGNSIKAQGSLRVALISNDLVKYFFIDVERCNAVKVKVFVNRHRLGSVGSYLR